MAKRSKSVGLVPASGGRLMTRLSADSVSAADYTRKQDWRRIADIEARREGLVPFWPNTSLPLGYQNFPQPPDHPVLISGTASAVATATGTGILQAASDPWSAQFDFPGGLNHNYLQGPRIFTQDSSFTVAGWVLLHNKTQESFFAASWIGGGNENWFIGFYYPTGDRWYCNIRTVGGVDQTLLGPVKTINNNTWHFVALVHDMVNLKIRLYTDGDVAETVTVGNKATIGGGFALGDRQGIYGADQRMDEVAAWTRALTNAELDTIYNAGVPSTYGNMSAGILTDCAAWWNFANDTQLVSPIDGSLYYGLIGTSIHPGGVFLDNVAPYSGGVLLAPYVGHANKAPLYP